MKILSFLTFFTLLGISAFAQTIELRNDEGTVISNTTYQLINDQQYNVQLFNTGTTDISIKCEVTAITIPSGTDAFFEVCYGTLCVPANSVGQQIGNSSLYPAGNTNTEANAHITYVPINATGRALISLKFYEEGNPSNSVTISGDTQFSSISQQIEKNNTVFPNPANDVLYISTGYTIAAAEIWSISGKFIQKSSTKNNCIDVSSLPAGIYFCKYSDGKVLKVDRFVICR